MCGENVVPALYSPTMLDVCRNTNGTTVHIQHFETEWMWQCNQERPNMGPAGMALKQRLMAPTETLILTRVKSGDYRLLSTLKFYSGLLQPQ